MWHHIIDSIMLIYLNGYAFQELTISQAYTFMWSVKKFKSVSNGTE